MAKSKDSMYRMDDNSDKNMGKTWGWSKPYNRSKEKKDWQNIPVEGEENADDLE